MRQEKVSIGRTRPALVLTPIQGGFGVSVRVVPLLENLIQGGIVAGSYLLERIDVGDDYLVVVVPK